VEGFGIWLHAPPFDDHRYMVNALSEAHQRTIMESRRKRRREQQRSAKLRQEKIAFASETKKLASAFMTDQENIYIF
jgi:hypothetical protein